MTDLWAYERARQIVDEQTKPGWCATYVPLDAMNAFARYIFEHEEPPVDHLYEALKAVVEMGRYDTREQTELLRREFEDRGLVLVYDTPSISKEGE